MLEEFESYREIVKKNMLDRKYDVSIDTIHKYLSILNHNHFGDLEDYMDDMWFCNYNIALCYLKKDDVYKACDWIVEADKYLRFKDYKYYQTRWLNAEIYWLFDNNFKAVQAYKECADFYRYIDDKKMRLISIFNIAKVLEKDKLMLKLINMLKRYDDMQKIPIYKNDMSNNKVLDEMLVDLAYVYSEKENIEGVFKTINLIKNKNCRRKISKLINVC